MMPWRGSDRVAVNTAVAARVGPDRISIVAGRPAGVRVNGASVEPASGTTMPLEGGGRLVAGRNEFTLFWPDGSTLTVAVHGDYLNAFLSPAEARGGTLAGLMGDFDGDPSNDFFTADGRLLHPPLNFESLYGDLAAGWRVRAEGSLFDYGPGESTETFTDTEFPAQHASVAGLSPEERQRADRACRENGVEDPDLLEGCVLDVGVSGDESFARTTASAERFIRYGPVIPTTYRTGNRLEFTFALGDRSFADRAEFTPGRPGPTPGGPTADPASALGPPDFRRSGDGSHVILGPGGSLTVEFLDNVLVDIPGPDLVIFFAGAGVHRARVAVSSDGIAFEEVSAILRAGEEAIDIAEVASPGARYTHVRIQEPNPPRGEGFRDHPGGPRVDAVGALGAERR
jgi:hypothetical protein